MTKALVLAASALFALCFWPGSWGICAWVVFIPLLWLVQDSPPREGFLWAWLSSTVFWILIMPWFIGTLMKFLKAGPVEAWALFLVFCAWHGLMIALPFLAARLIAPRLAARLKVWKASAMALTLVPAVVAAEAYFPVLFPIHLANTQEFHLPAVQSVELFGAGGLACLILGFNGAAYVALRSWWERHPRLKGLLIMALLVLLNEGYGLIRLRQIDSEVQAGLKSGKVLRVGIVQGSIPIDVKLDQTRFAEILTVHKRLTEEALAQGPLDLVVWPETSYARVVSLDDGGRRLVKTLEQDVPYRTTLLLSTIRESSGRRYNTSLLVGPDHELLGTMDKRHLMPFGEYMPLVGNRFPLVSRFNPRIEKRRMSPGLEQKLLTTPEGAHLGVLNCYEDLMADYARGYARLGADVLVNLTNDIWMGDGLALEQHLRLSSLRAVESRKYLLRAVNTGISAVIDPTGRVVARLEPNKRGVLVETIVPIDRPTWHTAIGRLPYHLALVVFLALGMLSFRRSGTQRNAGRASAFIAMSWPLRPHHKTFLCAALLCGVLYAWGAAIARAQWWDPKLWASMLTWMLALPIVVFGVNDVYDVPSDRMNPRKDPGYVETVARLRPRILGACAAVTLLMAGVSLLAGSPIHRAATLAALALAWGYSAPPVRLKEKPPLDCLSNSALLGAIALAGFAHGRVALSWLPLEVWLAFLGASALHVMLAIIDYEPDRRAGVRTIATAFGMRPAAVFAAAILCCLAAISRRYAPPLRLIIWYFLAASVALAVRADQKLARKLLWLGLWIGYPAMLAFLLGRLYRAGL